MEVLGMPESAKAVEAVYEQARIAINPRQSEKRAAASTVEQKKKDALSTLKESLKQKNL
jgi:hypothetical protein